MRNRSILGLLTKASLFAGTALLSRPLSRMYHAEESPLRQAKQHYSTMPEKNKTMEMVTLKNGKEVPLSIVVTTMMTLKNLIENYPIVFYELVMKCRDPNHEMWGDSEKLIAKFGLMQNGRVQSSVKDIVLSAVTGDDLDMAMSSPIDYRKKPADVEIHKENVRPKM